MMQALRALDFPPIWLLAMVALTWGFDTVMPWGLFGPAGQVVGTALVALGFAIMAVAAGQMVLARTTFVPRRDPDALVTGGVFAISRNPIYAADVLVLMGAILYWDVPVAVPLVLVFMAIIQHRFILGEEAVLAAHFGPAFEQYKAQTRRWLGRWAGKLPQSRN